MDFPKRISGFHTQSSTFFFFYSNLQIVYLCMLRCVKMHLGFSKWICLDVTAVDAITKWRT